MLFLSIVAINYLLLLHAYYNFGFKFESLLISGAWRGGYRGVQEPPLKFRLLSLQQQDPNIPFSVAGQNE